MFPKRIYRSEKGCDLTPSPNFEIRVPGPDFTIHTIYDAFGAGKQELSA